MRLPLAKEGSPFIMAPLLISVILLLTGLIQPGSVFLLMTAFALSFFRDPDRTPNADPATIVAAADGTILAINEINEDLYIKEPAIQIVTFLSVFNVHINRAPIAGVVDFQQYVPGSHYDSFNPKAHSNERNHIGIQNDRGVKILTTQISGSLARRIVSRVSVNQKVGKGERLGLIKFGSRTDVTIPKSKLDKILVKVGDKTRGAETPIAALKN